MDALLSFPGQSDTPDTPESGITHLDEGGAITYRTKLQLSFKYEPST